MTHYRKPTAADTYTYKVSKVFRLATMSEYYVWTIFENGKPFDSGKCDSEAEAATIGKAKAAFWNNSEHAAMELFRAIGDVLQ